MRAAFLDRDGVINEERDYVHRVEDFHLLPGAIEGMALLQHHGWKLVVVTNQAGIARRLYTEVDFAQLTAHLRALLEVHHIRLDGVYHCPHHPTAGIGELRRECECRKPRPGMLLAAAHDLGLELSASVIVGDKRSDLEAGRAAGLRACIAVESGHTLDAGTRSAADHCCAGLLDASRWIVSRG
jgi:D-glycero-D-manno-heptose 1,7-bisphosphate phosphatase